jgi:hypothetical protein
MTHDEFLKEAEEFAAILFPVSKLSKVLRMPEEEINLALATETSDLGLAIQRGWLRTEAEINQITLKLAKQGSTPALSEAVRLLKAVRS